MSQPPRSRDVQSSSSCFQTVTHTRVRARKSGKLSVKNLHDPHRVSVRYSSLSALQRLSLSLPSHIYAADTYLSVCMGQSAPSVVPEGYYPPFAVITDEDKGGWIIIATALGMAMALLSTGLRVYVKIMSRHQGGLDDLCLAAGTVFAFAQQGVVLGACSHGLGRTVDLLSSTELRNVEKVGDTRRGCGYRLTVSSPSTPASYSPFWLWVFASRPLHTSSCA